MTSSDASGSSAVRIYKAFGSTWHHADDFATARRHQAFAARHRLSYDTYRTNTPPMIGGVGITANCLVGPMRIGIKLDICSTFPQPGPCLKKAWPKAPLKPQWRKNYLRMSMESPSHRRASVGGFSPRAIADLRKTLVARREEIEAADKAWTIESLAALNNQTTSSPICSPLSGAKAASFFKKRSGNLPNVEKNIRQKFIEIYDPITNRTLCTSKSIIYRKYQFFFFFSSRNKPVILACVGSRPACLIYPTDKLSITISSGDDPHNLITTCLKLTKSYGMRFYRYLSVVDNVKSACVIGDERPTHYFLESLGSLQRMKDDGRIDAFWSSLDYLIVPTDYAFIPADELFDVPKSVQVILSPLSELNRIAFDRNLFIQRFMRTGHNMTEGLRLRILDYADKHSPALAWPDISKVFDKPEYVTAWFSVEIEKGRIQNQDEVFKVLAGVLSEQFGDRFRLIIDGWSPMPLANTSRDKSKLTDIKSFVRRMAKILPKGIDIVHAYTLPYRDKLKLCQHADFFVTMQGGAALVPSGLQRKPGITYHNTWGLSSYLEVWPDNLYQVRARYESLKEGLHPGRATFEVDTSAFRKTLLELIDIEKLKPR